MLCRICVRQMQPRKHVLQIVQVIRLPLSKMSYVDHTDQESICPCLKDLDHQVGIDYTDHLSEVCTFSRLSPEGVN